MSNFGTGAPGQDLNRDGIRDNQGLGAHPTMGERVKAAFIPARDAHEQAAMDRTGQTMSSSHGMGDHPTMGERAKAAIIPGRDSHEQAALDRSGYAGSGMTGTGMTGTHHTGTGITGTGMTGTHHTTGTGMTGTHGTHGTSSGTDSGIHPTMGQKVKAAFSSLTAEEVAMQDAQKKASGGTHPHGHKGEMATAGALATGHPVAAAGLAAGTHEHHHHSAQHAGTSSSTTTGTHGTGSGTGATADKPWVPRQFGPMPPGSTIKDPAHHPGFATHVVTEQIPVTDAAGREATITKQTVITAQETILGLLRRDQQLLQSLFQQWFATRDMTQREHLWWEIEHELQMLDAGHTGVLHSALNKHLTKDMGYDHSGSFREYSAMRSLVGDMNKLSVNDPTFETKMSQLQNMTNNYYMEQSRYLPLFEQHVGNQALIDYGTQYNMKKSSIRDTKHQSRLASNKTQSSNLHERDREHGAMADKHMEQGHKPTLKEKIFGTHENKSHDKTHAPASGSMPNMAGAYPNTSTHTATTTSSNTGRM